MEGIIFRPILKIVIREAVLVAGDNRLKILDMVVFIVKGGMRCLSYLMRINKKIGYMFAKLWRDADLCYSVYFGLIKDLSFTCLEEAKIGYLQFEVYLTVKCRDKLIKLTHLNAIHIEGRTRLFEKLSPLLLYLIILETDVA